MVKNLKIRFCDNEIQRVLNVVGVRRVCVQNLIKQRAAVHELSW